MSDAAFIIAEAGVNHNGSMETARRLIHRAREAGADAVKFQTFSADRLVSRSASKADYQERTSGAAETQHAMLKRLELTSEQVRTLLRWCNEEEIRFLSTPFDEASVDLLDELDVPLFKVGSGELTNLPFLEYIAAKGKPVILSTGMGTLAEVEDAVAVFREQPGADLTLLHCVTEYPAPPEEINLRAMATLRAAFGLPVGYSDHTTGVEIATAAVALGARVIEKHFTIDRSLPGPDHSSSLEPDEFRRMVAAIRNVEAAMGSGRKGPAPCELANIPVARRSIVAVEEIRAGEAITTRNVAIMRPGSGIAPKYLSELLGMRTTRDISPAQPLSWQDLR
jgi:N-acetylneuraminate synthase